MRSLLVRSRAFAAAMTRRLPAFAIVGIRADEHAAALVVGDDLVEIGVPGPAERAWRAEDVARARVILEVERGRRRMRRNGIDALFATGSEQLQRRTIVHFR